MSLGEAVLLSLSVAGMARRRDIFTCLQMVSTVVLCDSRNAFARFSEDDRAALLEMLCCVFLPVTTCPMQIGWHVSEIVRV